MNPLFNFSSHSRSRDPSARYSASRPGPGSGPDPSTHPATAQQTSSCLAFTSDPLLETVVVHLQDNVCCVPCSELNNKMSVQRAADVTHKTPRGRLVSAPSSASGDMTFTIHQDINTNSRLICNCRLHM